MTTFLAEHLRKPYGQLIAPASLVCLLLLLLSAISSFGLESAEDTRAQLAVQWAQIRKQHQQHQAAKRAKQDLAQVWAALPEERDFAPLALGITEEAKRNHVTLPALSYKTESTPVANTSKGLLQGTMSGRYEDLCASSTTSKRPMNLSTLRMWIWCRPRRNGIISPLTLRLLRIYAEMPIKSLWITGEMS